MKTPDNDSPKLDDPRVVEALDEYLAALEAGTKPDRLEFLARNAVIADVLAECLDGMEALHQAYSDSQSRLSAGPAPGDYQPGTPLGDYRLRREIGRGGMGVVYEAEQLSLGRRIALKVLPFALTLDPRQLQRFKNEARAAAQLHHQHIVPVYAVGSERGVHFYAMQYIEGQSLAEVIHDLRRAKTQSAVNRQASGGALAPRGRSRGANAPPLACGWRLNNPPLEETGPYFPQSNKPAPDTAIKPMGSLATSFSANSTGFYRTVARLGIQAAEALEHAHEYGVVHRDIKPGNLMVDGHGHLWVTDFGLAQFQSDPGLTQSGDLLGTLRYMSPEQANGPRVAIDHRTDIYSLGATLYELLTQRPPFEGSDRQTLLNQIVYEEPRPPRAIHKSIPVELETIVLKALAKSPAERYATAQELADDLACFLKDQPIRARRATAAQRLRKWTRRHPSIFWFAVILCFLTAAGSLLSAGLIREEQKKTEAAYQREKQRAQEAEEDFKLAREAVDGMFKLYDEELADKPFLDGLRQRLLQDYFLVYYQKLIDQRREDPAAQIELTNARARVQTILDNLFELQGVGQYLLLNNSDVVEELNPTTEQRAQIVELKDDMNKRNFNSFLAAFGLSPEERRQRLLEEARKTVEKANKVLSKKQVQRLRQIDLQSKGPRAFEDQDVIDKLHLNASQREKIRTIQAQSFQAVFGDCHHCPPDKRDGPPPPGGRGLPLHMKIDSKKPSINAVKQIEDDVLTTEQREQWQKLKGEPFKGVGPVPPGRGGPKGRPWKDGKPHR